MAYLVLVRHGQSEWNALGLWTGWHDTPLTAKGREEARQAAEYLQDFKLHKAHTSNLVRAQQTLDEIKSELNHQNLETVNHAALDERHYGDYTGKNKWQVKDEIGEVEFNKLRREWNYPVPNGETLKDVHDRAIPYYQEHIINDLKDGKNIIIAGHGNTLRALMKHLEEVDDNDVHTLEIGTGQVLVYEINNDGKMISKQIRSSGGKA
ncbi:MAG: 2,3-diphosphoglycerate-dependent phosphoglycerate mutase [Candidatus Saccharibacteria bacterium]